MNKKFILIGSVISVLITLVMSLSALFIWKTPDAPYENFTERDIQIAEFLDKFIIFTGVLGTLLVVIALLMMFFNSNNNSE